MPTCTVDRKRPGASASDSAARAPARPAAAACFRRTLRADTTAISASANSPLATTSTRMKTASMASVPSMFLPRLSTGQA